MTTSNIVIVHNNENLCNLLFEKLSNKYNDNYTISSFLTPKEALNFIENTIDVQGHDLTMVISYEKLNVKHDRSFLGQLSQSHPHTKIIMILEQLNQFITDRSSTIKVLKSSNSESYYNEIFEIITTEIKKCRNNANFNYKIDDITIKLVETLYEKKQFFKLRFSQYYTAGYKTKDTFRNEEMENNMEWDTFDSGGISELIVKHKIRYVIVKKKSTCIGGVRIIDGKCPMEEGICITNGMEYNLGRKYTIGDRFSLDDFRNKKNYTREISRLIIHPDYRAGDSKILMGLIRFIGQLTCDYNTLFCTTTERQLILYKTIGFEICGPAIQYSLLGKWIPMMQIRNKITNQLYTIKEIAYEYINESLKPIFDKKDSNAFIKYSKSANGQPVKIGFNFTYSQQGIG